MRRSELASLDSWVDAFLQLRGEHKAHRNLLRHSDRCSRLRVSPRNGPTVSRLELPEFPHPHGVTGSNGAFNDIENRFLDEPHISSADSCFFGDVGHQLSRVHKAPNKDLSSCIHFGPIRPLRPQRKAATPRQGQSSLGWLNTTLLRLLNDSCCDVNEDTRHNDDTTHGSSVTSYSSRLRKKPAIQGIQCSPPSAATNRGTINSAVWFSRLLTLRTLFAYTAGGTS